MNDKTHHHPALLQLSFGLGADDYTAVLQLRSTTDKRETPNIFHEGTPEALIRIFLIKNAKYGGKSVADDPYKILKLLGFKDWDIDNLEIIEAAHVFNFVDAFARGPKCFKHGWKTVATVVSVITLP